MSTIPRTRRTLALLAAGLLLFGAAGCGSSDGDKASDSPSADGGTDAGTDAGSGDGEASAGDPCQWYTAADMEALLGFPVTMEDQTVGAIVKCVYDAPEKYSSVEISLITPEENAGNQAFAESPAGVDVAGEVIAVDGVGDSGWGHSSPGGADIGVTKGDRAVGVAITTGAAREGEGSGNIATSAATLEIAKQIATEVLA